MKIIADENIPQVKDAFGSFGDIELYSGREITNTILYDADVLLVRSITTVDESLLKNTSIKFVGTATIGTDHIDINYLSSHSIAFADAAGCNAFSVAEYILCAVTKIYNYANSTFSRKSIGIIGYGNVGTKVAKFFNSIGFKTIINDPPLERKFGKQNFSSLEETLLCDIITLHVPLNLEGLDRTYHLLDENFIKSLKTNTILINSSRGPVVDNKALLKRISQKKDLKIVLDVWENEPSPIIELVRSAIVSTAHIAGYSLEGKLNGTFFIYQKFCNYLKAKQKWIPNYPKVEDDIIEIDSRDSLENILLKITTHIYDITYDSDLLKKSVELPEIQVPKYFDKLRKDYQTRREFNNYTIKFSQPNEELKNLLRDLRFNVI
jgi:erythronate-4-phosphate dehydrogenase